MTQSYDIVLDGQLGQRFGTLRWTETGGEVSGVFSLLGFDNPVSGRREGLKLELTHRLRTAVSTLICRTHAELSGDELSGIVLSGDSRMDLHGKKQKDGYKNEISEQDRLSGALPSQSLL